MLASISPVHKSGELPARLDLLRFTTAGSVDDGKSTLIGRLLYDSKAVYDDQLTSIRNSGINRADGAIDLSLLTDGLRAEREQGITIDVAYRYFSTPRRKFIIADTPGHEQYTRNMATGASNAHAAIVLIDATKGLQAQSRRHTYIASLLGIQEVVAAVNKMDLVGYEEEVFHAIAREFRDLANRLEIPNVYVVPVSALKGDNIVRASSEMPWFCGPALLEYLENISVCAAEPDRPLRLPIQYVIRPDSRFRGFAGQVASGVLRRGAPLIALPSGARTRVKSIPGFDGEMEQAGAGNSVTVVLENEIDLSRGDLLVGEVDRPHSSNRLAAKLVWMHTAESRQESYLLKHATRIVRAYIREIMHRVDVNTLSHLPASSLHMNDIAEVRIETTTPLFFDPYRENRALGSFILIDPITNATVAAGMIECRDERGTAAAGLVAAQDVAAQDQDQDQDNERLVQVPVGVRKNGYPPSALWIVGRHALAEKLERELFENGLQVQLISSAEFSSGGLESAAVLLQRAGITTIWSLTSEDPALMRRVLTAHGEHFFLHARDLPDSDTEAVWQTMGWLRR